MVLEELDGFIAGLLICPETIPPGEWFARAIGLSKRRPSPFVDLDHANDVLGLVMEYYDDVATTLQRHPERYRPRFSIDDNGGDVLWELWADGFGSAVGMRPEAWQPFLDAGGEVRLAMNAMMALVDIARADGGLADGADEDVRKIAGSAPDMIGRWVVLLHGRRPTTASTSTFADIPNPLASAGKIGRNDPCPCGSGRKYKRCCGAN
jgi:uncharacterized protein